MGKTLHEEDQVHAFLRLMQGALEGWPFLSLTLLGYKKILIVESA